MTQEQQEYWEAAVAVAQRVVAGETAYPDIQDAEVLLAVNDRLLYLEAQVRADIAKEWRSRRDEHREKEAKP